MNSQQTISEPGYFRRIATGSLILLAVGFILLQISGHRSPSAGSEAFFTVDDGKTWFADDASKIPPFDKDGKQAVLAFVYRCPDGSTFVNHLQRYNAQAKRVLEEPGSANPNTHLVDFTASRSAAVNGRELKRPGDSKWIPGDDFRAAAQVLAIKGPNGCTDAVPVQP